MIEFELKFQIPPARRDAVRAFVAGRQRPASPPIHLQATYFDTPQRLLAQSGIALRIRREGAVWVQTLKGAAADGIGREEHNLPLPDGGAAGDPPAIDPQRHRGVALGDRLIELLRSASGSGLERRYSSDVRRTLRRLKTRFGTVELAFDEGQLISATDRLAICELEIELIDGHPLAVVDVARRWTPRFGLWLDTRSKAERGDLLARGCRVSPARSELAAAPLHAQLAPRAALQALISAVRGPILANASQIASGTFDDEHVHQLRVMLRRLRVDLRLFDGDAAAAALARPMAAAAAELFRGLGAGRDQSVLAGQLSADIEAALRRAGDAGDLPMPTVGDGGTGMVELVRGVASQRLLLDLVEATLPAFADGRSAGVAAAQQDAGAAGLPAPAPARPIKVRKLLAKRLDHWQRSVSRAAGRFDRLDDTARHALRKHVKRLRYAIGAASGLLDKRSVRSFEKPLKDAQRVLGDLNDLSTAFQAFGGSSADPRAWFARGWLMARQQALLDAAVKPMKRLARVTRKKGKLR